MRNGIIVHVQRGRVSLAERAPYRGMEIQGLNGLLVGTVSGLGALTRFARKFYHTIVCRTHRAGETATTSPAVWEVYRTTRLEGNGE